MPTGKELEATMERHAPAGYDPAADDMTVPFAIKLAEQDETIARLRKALKFYANASEADWQNDHGHNANAALTE